MSEIPAGVVQLKTEMVDLMKLPIKLNLRRIFKNSVRLYFSPLTGAVRGVRRGLRRMDRAAAK
jgi:hypothetical protein